jgi:ribosomal protein L16/L10AE
LSTGMTQSFGVAIGRAALVPAGKELFLISCKSERVARIAKDVLGMVKSKIPCKSKIIFQKIR